MNIFDDALWPQTVKQEIECDLAINNKFIFIQIPKNGTTSVVTELKRIGLTQNIKCFRHEGLKYIQHLYPNKNIPVYAIVRNPFRQTLSYFFHRVNYGEIFVNKNNIVMEFRKWCKESKLNKNIHLLQTKYLETNNEIIKKKIKIFKFEDGIDFFIKYLNATYELNLDFEIHNNQNKISEYKNIPFLDFFDNETIELIKKDLHLQFETFSYSKDIKLA
jgi:hypothetical protein